MKFNPKNRHLLVLPIEEEQEEEGTLKILTPSNYKKPTSPYLRAQILEIADDCRIQMLKKGDNIVIERRMLHDIEIEAKTFYLVLENYVFGRIDK
tara:strand:+ start:3896 stop:4180 length:285 start_codon:yes stop_codon:yes gene_type:complete